MFGRGSCNSVTILNSNLSDELYAYSVINSAGTVFWHHLLLDI